MFSHAWRYGFMLLLGAYSYFNTVYTETYEYYHIPAPWYWILLNFLLISTLIWEGNRLLEKRITFLRGFLRKHLGLRWHPLVLFFLASLLSTALASALPPLLIGRYILAYDWATFQLPFKLAIAFGFRINLFLHCINTITYYMEEYRRKQVEAEELRKITTQAQLQSLRDQINPHFLFNNLNVLSALILKDSRMANEFVEEFSKVYRYVLKNYEKELIALREEIDFIKSYLFLLEKRFEKNLHVSLEVPEAYLGHYIVPMALQMLIENAIKHNIVAQKKPLHIRIGIEDDALVVANTLQRKTVAEHDSTQIGLKNISARYQFINAGKQVLVEESSDTFAVRLPLIALQSPTLSPHESIDYRR